MGHADDDELGGKGVKSQIIGGGDHDDGGGDELGAQSELDAALDANGEDVRGEEGAEEADEDAEGGNEEREAESSPSRHAKTVRLRSNDQRRTGGL